MADRLVKALAFYDQIRITAIEGTETVQEAQTRHQTLSNATAALGRTLIGTLLLASDNKSGSSMSVRISGNGPLGSIVTSADDQGHVRGFVQNPEVQLEPNDQGKIDVRSAVGTEGTLAVTKRLAVGQPFSGEVPLVSGEIAEDFTYYLAKSEQIPSAVALGVLVNPDQTVQNAGGYFIQVLPDAEEETIAEVEKRVAEAPSVTEMLSQGMSVEDMTERILGAENLHYISGSEVGFKCFCSKERFAGGLLALAKEELEAMIEEDHGAEIICQFCRNRYTYSELELEALLAKKRVLLNKSKKGE